MMAQALKFLPPMWETKTKHWALSFSLTQPWAVATTEWVKQRIKEVPLSLSLCMAGMGIDHPIIQTHLLKKNVMYKSRRYGVVSKATTCGSRVPQEHQSVQHAVALLGTPWWWPVKAMKDGWSSGSCIHMADLTWLQTDPASITAAIWEENWWMKKPLNL